MQNSYQFLRECCKGLVYEGGGKGEKEKRGKGEEGKRRVGEWENRR